MEEVKVICLSWLQLRLRKCENIKRRMRSDGYNISEYALVSVRGACVFVKFTLFKYVGNSLSGE